MNRRVFVKSIGIVAVGGMVSLKPTPISSNPIRKYMYIDDRLVLCDDFGPPQRIKWSKGANEFSVGWNEHLSKELRAYANSIHLNVETGKVRLVSG